MVNIDISHPLSFARYLETGDRARYAAVYNDGFRGDDEVEGFIKNHGLHKRCSSIEELADSVDIGFVQSCNWDKHLEQALPFIRRGKPVFIDKPLFGSLKDCKAAEDLVARGAVILGSSSVRYAQEVIEFVSRPEDDRGVILNIFGTAGMDEFNYAIHIMEAICGLARSRPLSTAFCGGSRRDGKTCETFFVRFENGITATYNTFHGAGQPFEVVIMTGKSTHRFCIDTGKLYPSLLDRICKYMETGVSTLASIEELTDAVRVMLAGRLSRERGGGDVLIKAIPEDDPGYDGYEFERAYAAASGKIYL